MAPAVGAKGNRAVAVPQPHEDRPRDVSAPDAAERPVSNKPIPAEVENALKQLAKAQKKALKNSTWVGKDFAKASREMHYGERDQAAIHGQASLEEAKSLAEEGVQVAALPFPVAPPDKLN